MQTLNGFPDSEVWATRRVCQPTGRSDHATFHLPRCSFFTMQSTSAPICETRSSAPFTLPKVCCFLPSGCEFCSVRIDKVVDGAGRMTGRLGNTIAQVPHRVRAFEIIMARELRHQGALDS
jgi:hypothetical protein